MDVKFKYIALIPAFGAPPLWSISGESLLSRAIDIALSISHVEHIFVATNNSSVASAAAGRNVTILEFKGKNKGPLILGYYANVLLKVTRHISKNFSSAYNSASIIILDPCCPLRTTVHINTAVEIYEKLGLSSRYFAMMSMSKGPLNYHPKKLVVLSENGGLRYYNPVGKNIFNRQQIENDPYYYHDGEICIVDTRLIKMLHSIYPLVYPIINSDALLLVQNKADIHLIEDLIRQKQRP